MHSELMFQGMPQIEAPKKCVQISPLRLRRNLIDLELIEKPNWYAKLSRES